MPPDNARNAAISLASLLTVGRAGEGDVANNNIRSAASSSVGAARGVACSGTLLAGDGVRLRAGGSAVEVTDAAVGLAADATVAVVVRAEL